MIEREYYEYAMYINGVLVDRFTDICDEIAILDKYTEENDLPDDIKWDVQIRTGILFDFTNEENKNER